MTDRYGDTLADIDALVAEAEVLDATPHTHADGFQAGCVRCRNRAYEEDLAERIDEALGYERGQHAAHKK